MSISIIGDLQCLIPLNLRPLQSPLITTGKKQLPQSETPDLLIVSNMRLTSIIFTAAAASTVHGLSLAEVRSSLVEYTDKLRRSLPEYGLVFTRSPAPAEVETRAACPAVWTSIVTEMQGMFIDKSTTPSQCNDDARAAIRVCPILSMPNIPF